MYHSYYKKNELYKIFKGKLKLESNKVSLATVINHDNFLYENLKNKNVDNYTKEQIEYIFIDSNKNKKNLIDSLENFNTEDYELNLEFVSKYNEFKSEKELFFYKNSFSKLEIKKNGNSLLYIQDNISKERIKSFFEFYREVSNLPNEKSEKYLKKLPILFSNQSASIISHECFGHIFEIDNFIFRRYDVYLNEICKLPISISDNPLIKNCVGSYLVDDAGFTAKKIIILKDGVFTGKLIGGDLNNNGVNRSLRREFYYEKLIPRMSNLIITTTSYNKNISGFYIEISKLDKCYLNHTKKQLLINTTSAYLKKDKDYICNLSPIKLQINLDKFYKNISPIFNNNEIYPIVCQKNRQLIDAGASSCSWIYNN